MTSVTDISIVLGSYNRFKFLKRTIASIVADAASLRSEIIVVDGGSTDGALEWLTRQKNIITIVQHNRGRFNGRPLTRRSWGYFMNLGFKASQGKYIMMLSDDCLLVPGSTQNGFDYFEKLLHEGRQIGALAFYWRNWPEQTKYWVGKTLGGKMFVNHGMYLRKAVQQVGWIDETNYFFYHADGDLCLKLWSSGYEVLDCPNSFVEHTYHTNRMVRSSNLADSDWKNYVRKWKGIFDPQTETDSDWIYRSYLDPYRTVMKFPISCIIRAIFKKKIRDFKCLLKNRTK